MARRLPMQVRGKRPRFFETQGNDELVSMMLEMMAELWTVKERLYVLEKAATKGGFPLSEWIESYEVTEADDAELTAARKRLISTVLRSIETDFVDRAALQKDLDATMPGHTQSGSARAA